MPKTQNALMFLIALAIGGAAFVLTMKSITPPEKKPDFYVVGLAEDLEVGTTVQREHLELMPAPQNIDKAALFTKPEEVVGKVLNRSIQAGTPLRSIDMMSEGENIASLIPEGYQAMTIPVVMPQSLVSLVQVGNRVDVLLTYERSDTREYKSITLMKNVKVIGVSKEAEGATSMYVTIAVNPAGAKTLAYAIKRGVLNLAIRSLSEADQQEPETFYTLEKLFREQLLDQAVKKSKVPMLEEIEIIRGLNKETYRFVEGKAKTQNSEGAQPSQSGQA